MLIEESGKTYCIVESVEDLQWCQEYVKEATALAVDTETCGSKAGYSQEKISKKIKAATRNDNILLGISVSKDANSGFYIPVCKNPKQILALPKDLFAQAMSFMQGLMQSDVKWVMHNGLFEESVMGRYLGVGFKNWFLDTSIAAHELDENGPMGLKELGVLHFGADADEEKRAMLPHFKELGYRKVEMGLMYLLPLEVVGKYAIKDTMLTIGLGWKFYTELKERNMLERYEWKHDVVETVYTEIGKVGWCIDEARLERNESLTRGELEDISREMYQAIKTDVRQIEYDSMDKVGTKNPNPIKPSAKWIKEMIVSESLEYFFQNKKDPSKLTLGDGVKEKFLESEYAAGTFTEELLEWDAEGGRGTMEDKVSPPCVERLRNLQRKSHIDLVSRNQAKEGRLVLPYVFSFNSPQQITKLFFDTHKLPIYKETASGNPSTDANCLKKTQRFLQESVMDDAQKNEWAKLTDKKSKATWQDKLVFLKGLEPKLKWKIDPVKSADVTEERWNHCRMMVMVTMLLQFKDWNKMHGTYLNGLGKFLYTANQLQRPTQYSAHDPKQEVKYLISNLNPMGTVTGRPSSASPNLNNIPNVAQVKEAFVAPQGYKLLSADLSAQEVRVACTLARDAGMKDAVFTNRCNKCNFDQPYEVSLKIRMDYNNQLGTRSVEWQPKEFYKAGTPVLYDGKPYIAQNPGETSETSLEDDTQVSWKEGEAHLVPHSSVRCVECGAFDWSEPDPHSLVASRVYPEIAETALAVIKRDYSSLRQNAKIIGFQILYGATAMAIAESVFGSTEKDNVEKADELINQYLREAPDLAQAIEDAKAQAQVVGYVETLGGYRRHFPELLQSEPPNPGKRPKLDEKRKALKCFGWADPYYDPNDPSSEMTGKVVCPRWNDGEDEGCPFIKSCRLHFDASDFKRKKQRALRQAFNALIQGTSADITNEGLRLFIKERNKRMLAEPIWAKVKVVGNIYDAAYIYSPDGIDHKKVYRVLIDAFEDAFRDKQFVPQILEPEDPSTDWSQCH